MDNNEDGPPVDATSTESNAMEQDNQNGDLYEETVTTTFDGVTRRFNVNTSRYEVVGQGEDEVEQAEVNIVLAAPPASAPGIQDAPGGGAEANSEQHIPPQVNDSSSVQDEPNNLNLETSPHSVLRSMSPTVAQSTPSKAAQKGSGVSAILSPIISPSNPQSPEAPAGIPPIERTVKDDIQKLIAESQAQQAAFLDIAHLFRTHDPLLVTRRELLVVIKGSSEVDPIQANPTVMLHEEMFVTGLAKVLKVGMRAMFSFLGRWYRAKIVKILKIEDDNTATVCKTDETPGNYRYYGNFANECTEKSLTGYARDKVLPFIPNAPVIDQFELPSSPPKDRHPRYSTIRAASRCEKYDTVTYKDQEYVVSRNDKFSRKLLIKDPQTKVRTRVSYFEIEDIKDGKLSWLKRKKRYPRNREDLMTALHSIVTVSDPEDGDGDYAAAHAIDGVADNVGADVAVEADVGVEEVASAPADNEVLMDRRNRKRKKSHPNGEDAPTLNDISGKIDGVNKTLGDLVTNVKSWMEKPVFLMNSTAVSDVSPVQFVQEQHQLTGTEVYRTYSHHPQSGGATSLTPEMRNVMRVTRSPGYKAGPAIGQSPVAGKSIRQLNLPHALHAPSHDVPSALHQSDDVTILTDLSIEGFLGDTESNTTVGSAAGSIYSSNDDISAPNSTRKLDSFLAKELNKRRNRDGSLNDSGAELLMTHFAAPPMDNLNPTERLLKQRSELYLRMDRLTGALEENEDDDLVSAAHTQQEMRQVEREIQSIDAALKTGVSVDEQPQERTNGDASGGTAVDSDSSTMLPPATPVKGKKAPKAKTAAALAHQDRMRKLDDMAAKRPESTKGQGPSATSTSLKQPLNVQSIEQREKQLAAEFDKCFPNTQHATLRVVDMMIDNRSKLSVSLLKKAISASRGVLIFSPRVDVHYLRCPMRLVIAIPRTQGDITLHDQSAYDAAKNEVNKSRRVSRQHLFNLFAETYLDYVYMEPSFHSVVIAASTTSSSARTKRVNTRHNLHELFDRPFNRMLFLANEFLCTDQDPDDILIGWYMAFKDAFKERNMRKVYAVLQQTSVSAPSSSKIGDCTIGD